MGYDIATQPPYMECAGYQESPPASAASAGNDGAFQALIWCGVLAEGKPRTFLWRIAVATHERVHTHVNGGEYARMHKTRKRKSNLGGMVRAC